MQHDLFHVYTVDQHILMVLRNVRRFFMSRACARVSVLLCNSASLGPPWILYVAALFHDIGKGRGGDHPNSARARGGASAANTPSRPRDAR